MLEDILKHTEESFEFSKTHQYSNINLFIASLFNLQIQLEKYKDKFKEINLYQIILRWVDDMQKKQIVGTYEYNLSDGYFYIYPKHENWKSYSPEYKLLLPSYNEDTVA